VNSLKRDGYWVQLLARRPSLSKNENARPSSQVCYNDSMLGKGARFGLIIGVVVVVAAIILWWSLPRLVAAMPGRVRHYVPEVVLAAVTTPLPTALPAPVGPTSEALVMALATSTPFPTATIALQATGTEAPHLPTPTAAPSLTPSPTPPVLPDFVRLEGVPIIPQKFNNCGPTNLTLVLNYYDLEVDQFDIAAVIRPNYEDRNVTPQEMVEFARNETNLDARAYSGGELTLLRQLLAAGFPIIIEKGLVPNEATGWMGHYLTLTGYDEGAQQFIVRDTYLGPWQEDGFMTFEDIQYFWQQFNDTFIVVFELDQRDAVSEILGESFASEREMWHRAADRARLAIAADEQNAYAWFNLGTSLTALASLVEDGGSYGPASAAFDQARLLGLPPRMLWYQFAPYEAYLADGRYNDVIELTDLILNNQGGRNVEETYLYRGLALRALGDEIGAGRAFSRAIQLNPGSPVATQAELAMAGVP
jgi:tetratricopeptide (TPR) repeat protein